MDQNFFFLAKFDSGHVEASLNQVSRIEAKCRGSEHILLTYKDCVSGLLIDAVSLCVKE